MKRTLIIASFLTMTCVTSFGQLLMTKNGVISFHSHTFLEDIDAVNEHVLAVIDAGKKNIAFSLLQTQFVFPRKLMQQHFNESYIESDKYPKATFSGSYTENPKLDKDGVYPINVKGKITMHGVSKELTIPATLTVLGGVVKGESTFKLNPSDFNITIPLIVRDKIEKENTVKVKVEWTPKF